MLDINIEGYVETFRESCGKKNKITFMSKKIIIKKKIYIYIEGYVETFRENCGKKNKITIISKKKIYIYIYSKYKTVIYINT